MVMKEVEFANSRIKKTIDVLNDSYFSNLEGLLKFMGNFGYIPGALVQVEYRDEEGALEFIADKELKYPEKYRMVSVIKEKSIWYAVEKIHDELEEDTPSGQM
jgi:hypothetical protein